MKNQKNQRLLNDPTCITCNKILNQIDE